MRVCQGGIGALALILTAVPLGAAPQRVVSLNLCTDQLAMLLAAPGQLASVSFLSREPRLSAMAGQAGQYPINHGRAEEVFLLRPDLVLAGTYTSRPAVAMLRRLGIAVEEFPVETSLDDVRRNLTRMGDLLGRETRAAQMIAQFEAGLAALRSDPARRPRAALYSANGYTTGQGGLPGDILAAAGYDNIAGQAGVPGGGTIPLEVLVMLAPDMIITASRYPGASQAEALMDHPALAGLTRADAPVTDANWVCGTPFVLDAVAALVDARQRWEAGE